jgi:hypothetical protein
LGKAAEAQGTNAQAEIADAASVNIDALRDPQADTDRAVQPEVRFRAAHPHVRRLVAWGSSLPQLGSAIVSSANSSL